MDSPAVEWVTPPTYACLNCGRVPVADTMQRAFRVELDAGIPPGWYKCYTSVGTTHLISPRTCNRCGSPLDEGTWRPPVRNPGGEE